MSEKTREIRLGLVLYGGVSLAIYINGVAHEFFRAVRGRGIYRLIKALTDSDIIVDVVSGTSAGGINGVMLSYALCNERDFAAAADLWRMHGDIGKLMRAPAEEDTATSLLNSEGFYQPKLEEVFKGMRPYAPESHEDNSPMSELDLFVTSTNVHGRIYTQFDDAGHPIDVKDHRALFRLSHRAGRKEPFKVAPALDGPGDLIRIEALAKLSRATSCFPAAFAPVHIAEAKPEWTTPSSADGLLQAWGKLGGGEVCFVDGGVLDNKPFSYTIKAIFSRCADREVERKLFFVEPDPECMQPPKAADTPNMLQIVLAALIGIPGYESIADDLKLLTAHNSKIEQYNRLVRHCEKTGAAALPAHIRATWVRTRGVAICDRVLRGLFRTDGRDQPIVDPVEREHARRLVVDFDNQLNGKTRASAKLLERFDVDYRLRRVARLIYELHNQAYGSEQTLARMDEANRQRLRWLWRAFNAQFQTYEIVRAGLERFIDMAEIPWKDLGAREIWKIVNSASLHLLDSEAEPGRLLENFNKKKASADFTVKDAWFDAKARQDFKRLLFARSQKIVDKIAVEKGASTFPKAKRSILTVLKGFDDWLLREILTGKDEVDKTLRRAAEEFDNLDAQLYPLEVIGDLQEKDIIETIRISPRDAKRGFSNQSFSDKVSGDAVYHFGGFFKRSWRSNDILWGRLDGLCQLIETLLDPKRIRQLVDEDGSREVLRKRFFKDGVEGEWNEALDPTRLFPRAGRQTHDELCARITDMLSNVPDKRNEILPPADAVRPPDDAFSRFLSLLVEAAQLEVLGSDFTNVLEDAINEQAEWNFFKIPAPVSNEPVPEASKDQIRRYGEQLMQAQEARAFAEGQLRDAKKTQREMVERVARAKVNVERAQHELREAKASAKRLPAEAEAPDDLEAKILAHVAATPFTFQARAERYDPLFAGAASSSWAHLTLKTLEDADPKKPKRPTETRLGKFFIGSYRVGSEELTRDVPPLVLLDLLARTLIVTRNCVVQMLPPKLAQKIQSSLGYRFGLKWPLVIFHYLVIFARRAPHWQHILAFTVLPVSLLALVVSVLVSTGSFDFKVLFLFFLVPSLAITLMIGIVMLSVRKFGRAD